MIWSQLMRGLTWPAYQRFLANTRDPLGAQKHLWEQQQALLKRAPFWLQRLGKPGKALPPLSAFPLTTYNDYSASLEESFSSKVSTLSGDTILFWGETSGTSGTRKLFPLTRHFQAQFQLTTPPYVHALMTRFPGALSCPMLYFAGNSPTERSPAGIEVGRISNFNYRNIPKILQSRYAFPLEVFESTTFFYEWAPLYALATDLSAMVAITPEKLSLFAHCISENRKKFMDFLDGKFHLPHHLPPLKITAQRRQMLRQVLSSHNGNNITFQELWPSLRFVSCWISSVCALQLPRLKKYLGEKIPVVDATYSATEGWINVPLATTTAGGPVHPGAHIVEFLKEGDEADARNLVPLNELQENQNYEIILTTAMGFVRYRLFDIVRCNGYFNRSPLIEFVQKSGNIVLLGVVKLRETHILEAMAQTSFQLSGRWFFAPAADGRKLTLYHSLSQEDLDTQLSRFHVALGAVHSEYAAESRTGVCLPITSQLLPETHPAFGVAEHAQSKQVVLRQRMVL